ncbi:DNAH3 [Cordylochernes scorpioides]|uniref:DNAH3 n=1 Tax=Cordylochernes scorpioides TaxID=51811 RepID=A0ABY6LHN6_9ARAC|nr:DNAH3 [Cordylochernes scorpioides]
MTQKTTDLSPSQSLVAATRDVYRACSAALLPTPAKCHYVFSLRDMARVLHGVLLVPPTHLSDPGKLLRLWVHEVYRVFSDRLVEDADRHTFLEVVSSQAHHHFKQTLESLLSHLNVAKSGAKLKDEHVRNLLFVDYLNPDDSSKVYDEVTDISTLASVVEHYLAEYNRIHKTPLNMVMFKYAIEHISRISRVLKQGSGHLLLIGVSGCGRRYVVRLATFMAGYKYCSIEMAPGYTSVQWREDLKKVLMTAGGDGQPMSFLFSDTQVTNDAMVEDINMILHSGDIPNLFAADEKGEIMEKMQVKAKEMGRKVDAMSLSLYNFFVDRVRQNLHLVLHVSPLNPAFRSRLLRFPTLISCCTLDWFQAWPEGALEMVATKFLDKVALDEGLRPQLVTLCMSFNSCVHRLAKRCCNLKNWADIRLQLCGDNRFYEELGRRTYITPSSYLELILTFQSLLDRKQKELLQQRNRYLKGYLANSGIIKSQQSTKLSKGLNFVPSQKLDTPRTIASIETSIKNLAESNKEKMLYIF